MKDECRVCCGERFDGVSRTRMREREEAPDEYGATDGAEASEP